ncbi:MAG TPA: AgmX/PglI C-terminal domain-containing protein [Kofleriaceae bacterium]|nr:AgmX/PglI C-terminal domain-containing protein [Kofleriaceae bacterium]
MRRHRVAGVASFVADIGGIGGIAAIGAAVACGGGAPRDPGPRVSPVPLTRVAVDDREPDDDVQVVHGKGHLEPAAVEAGLRPHRDALTRCYTEKVGRRRWLAGHVVLRWDVAADGTVARVLLAESDLGAWPIERCLLDVARRATFGKPVGGDAELTLPLDLAPPGKPAAPVVWDAEQSARAIGPQLGKLDACARGKLAAPTDVAITLHVAPRGHPESIGFASPTSVLDDAWAECAEKAALDWHLPDPRSPAGQMTRLAVRYRPSGWTSSPRKNSS